MSGDIMDFPDRWEDFIERYNFADRYEIYTNGAKLIPAFRVEQMVEHYFDEDYKQAAEYWQRMYEQSFTEAETVVLTGITTVTDTPQITYVPERTCHNTHENRWFKCSACSYGFTDLYADDEHDINEQPYYCPNCGAKVVNE